MFSNVLLAHRGEFARLVIRTLKTSGIDAFQQRQRMAFTRETATGEENEPKSAPGGAL